MNYLAHAYLSFGVPDIAVGNLISDFVKGKKKLDYPETIQHGITLHRAIDTFTDTHPITQKAKLFFRPNYGLYSGAIVDILYDHYLANDPDQFPSPGSLGTFALQTYQQLGGREPLFPERFARLFPYMRSQNWLYNYRHKEGIYNSLHGLARRATHMPDPDAAFQTFNTRYEQLQDCYRRFFPELKEFAFNELQRLSPS
ncbi:MAG TPA: ACP phosphodiesterase [Puia sp.]|nr:ACP phosphodiesterase [Puia sp.]